MPGGHLQDEVDPKTASINLAALMERELHVTIAPYVLCQFIVSYWDRVSLWSHKIHDGTLSREETLNRLRWLRNAKPGDAATWLRDTNWSSGIAAVAARALELMGEK